MRFKTRLILIIVSIIFVTGGMISFIIIENQIDIHEKNYKRYTDLKLEATRFGIEISLADGNYEDMFNILEWSLQDSLIVQAILTDKEGEEEIFAVRPETDVELEYLYSKLLDFDIKNDTLYTSASWKATFGDGDELKGRLILGFSTKAIKKEIAASRFRSFFTVGLLVIIAIIIATLLANTITKPIENLRNVALEIGKGNQVIKANDKTGSPDVKVLASSFNDMLDKLNKMQKSRIDELSSWNKTLEDKNEQILSSIRYARTIQTAILPSFDNTEFNGIDYFVLYKPKDIVSGDFFWMEKVDDKVFIVVADCTGHGVPGAMISMLGNSILNDVILRDQIYDTGEILYRLDRNIINSLGQENENSFSSDGMDIGIVMIDLPNKKMFYSGAYRPLLSSDGQQLYETKGDRFHAGGLSKREKSFITNSVTFDKACSYYLTSDGFVDQLGKNGKKFGTKNFKNKVVELAKHDINSQGKKLNNTLVYHMGDETQRDDITVLGFRIT